MNSVNLIHHTDLLTYMQCETFPQVDALSTHHIYMKNCVQHIIKNDCPSTLMCAANCASDGSIDPATSKIIPFNNYGVYSLRIRICLKKIHQVRLDHYSLMQVDACKTLEEFEVCSKWIPPLTFVPVALPINTTYIEVDSCTHDPITGYQCFSNPPPTRIFGNTYLFPRSFDVAQTKASSCFTDSTF